MSLNDTLINDRVKKWAKAVAGWSISKNLSNIEVVLREKFEEYLFLEEDASPHYPDGLRREITEELLQEFIRNASDKEDSMSLLGFDCTQYDRETLISKINWSYVSK